MIKVEDISSSTHSVTILLFIPVSYFDKYNRLSHAEIDILRLREKKTQHLYRFKSAMA